MRKLISKYILLSLLITLGLAFTGCSDSDNPMAPETPDDGGQEEILTPKSLKINKISVSNFGDKNGGVWDLSTSVSKRRADLYVRLRVGTSVNDPIYISNVVEDAFPGAPYDFTDAESDVGLPRTSSATRRVYVELMDDDGLSADDLIGSIKFDPLDYYNNDNSTGFYKVFFGTNSTKVTVSGTWIY